MTATLDHSTVEINFSPSKTTVKRFNSVAFGLPMVGALIAIGALLVLAIQRIPYPYELDWLESGMLEHVRRLVNGQPLYTQPSATFTQYPYAPLSFGVGALFAEIFGVHFWLMRSISFASTLGVFALIFYVVRREATSVKVAFIAVGVFAGSYKLTGTWFDIGKADDLFMFVSMGALTVTRYATTRRSYVLAGFLMALSVMTKQTGVFVFAPMALYLMATRRRFGLYFTFSGLIFGVGSTMVLDLISHGWFNYFVWELLFQHPLISTSKLDFIRIDMKPFWPVAVLIVLALPELFSRDRLWSTGFWIFALGGLVAGAWSSRLHTGGSFNVLIPAFAAAAIALGIAVGTIAEWSRNVIVTLGLVVLCCAQLAFVRYDVGAQVPTALDKQTGDNFIAWLKTVNGPVFIYPHPTYAVMAGKPDFASEGGSEDVLRGTTLHAKADFERSMAAAIHERKYAAIILDGDEDTRGFPADWLSYYKRVPGSPVPPNNAWRPIDLYTGRPSQVYEPIDSNAITLPYQ